MVVAQCLQTERCSEISSSPCFSCAMMGLQATSGKRKLEGGVVGCMDFDMELGESPSKVGRVEASWWAMDDGYSASSPTASYYDMEVAAPSCLQSSTSCQLNGSSGPTLPTNSAPSPSSPAQQSAHSTGPQPGTPPHHNHHHHHQSHHQQPTSQQHYYPRPGTPQVYTTPTQPSPQQQQVTQQQLSRSQQQPGQWGHHAAAPHHYEPPTIRREENGKSYLELGSSYRANERCCEGSRSSWCRRGRACYRQRRNAVWSISMVKLSRFRQFPDPSLHRSVLICNTLRYLEREMERDRSPPPVEPVMPMMPMMTQLQPPEQGRLTPFPVHQLSSSMSVSETDVDSGIGDNDDSRSINWGSVLSLSSQSPLDPLNNNELLDVDIGPELDLDFMPGWKLTSATTTSNTTTTNSTTQHQLTTTTTTTATTTQLQQHHHQTMDEHQLQSSVVSSSNHHHHHHHSLTTIGSNGGSSSTTHESLMCVGS
ncbi:uncharacterized protein LOC106640603 isoform X2 [Copidosoma floridanum]|uniref:uncharacterized protein LOC106640603 isoform X2 n=1 Tax=Copidosoma floridanum TaxID=29053 RepID=UPI0006C97B95|nr:uncharacterized protein LOC106640603 isoform X2 [Copidosoma floridanum]